MPTVKQHPSYESIFKPSSINKLKIWCSNHKYKDALLDMFTTMNGEKIMKLSKESFAEELTKRGLNHLTAVLTYEQFSKLNSPTKRKKQFEDSFVPGEKIKAQWKDGNWYNASIIRRTERGFRINYYEFGEEADQEIEKIKKTALHNVPLPEKLQQKQNEPKMKEQAKSEKAHQRGSLHGISLEIYKPLLDINHSIPLLQKGNKMQIVREWLSSMNLVKYAHAFEEHEYDNMELINKLNNFQIEEMIKTIGCKAGSACSIRMDLQHAKKKQFTPFPEKIMQQKSIQQMEDDLKKSISLPFKVDNEPMPKGWKPLKNQHHLDLSEKFKMTNNTYSVSHAIKQTQAGVKTPNMFYAKSTRYGIYFKLTVTRKETKKMNKKESSNKNLDEVKPVKWWDLPFDTIRIMPFIHEAFNIPWWVPPFSRDIKNLCSLFSSSLGDIPTDVLQIIMVYCREIPNKQMDLSKCQISDVGAQNIAQGLKINTTITSLDMRYNPDIGTIGGKALYNVLKKSEYITEFSNVVLSEINGANLSKDKVCLSWKQLGNCEAIVIAEYLKSNTILTKLDLLGGFDRTNSSIGLIDVRGAAAIAGLLKVNSVLKELILAYNKLGDEGANVISESLKSNSTLTKLDQCGNNIGDSSTKALIEALKVNTTLTTLIIAYNEFTCQGISILRESQKGHPSLKKFHLLSYNE